MKKKWLLQRLEEPRVSRDPQLFLREGVDFAIDLSRLHIPPEGVTLIRRRLVYDEEPFIRYKDSIQVLHLTGLKLKDSFYRTLQQERSPVHLSKLREIAFHFCTFLEKPQKYMAVLTSLPKLEHVSFYRCKAKNRRNNFYFSPGEIWLLCDSLCEQRRERPLKIMFEANDALIEKGNRDWLKRLPGVDAVARCWQENREHRCLEITIKPWPIPLDAE
ncbi:hypothetical protein L596_000912 [Steinernema carpocapsae]|uniref:Uncharacterized protein n=1 Tax=Steinernema carpocapsae TaxID=34508 RepID=A0A4U8UNQ2_STECR|nr:hypothetical protein L596_000912 [Steinernema carpocapsae]